MPSLHAFGRRWSLSSDDFVFPQVSEGLYRFTWFVILLCVYYLHLPSHCGSNITTYILGMLLLNSILVFLCFTTAYVSGLGSLTNPNPRRSIPLLLHLRLPLILFEVIWNILGSVWLTNSVSGCDAQIVWAARVSVFGGWLMFIILLLGVWSVFDPLGHQHHMNISSRRTKSLWKRRLQCLFCCVGGQDDSIKSAFEDVAQLLTDLFHDTDLVASDVWAGLIMLASRDVQVLSEARFREPSRISHPDWMNVEYASRMANFASGAYGWPFYAWENIFNPRGLIDLFKNIKMCTQCRCDQVLVVRDNCCMCNTAAFLLQTGIQREDLFHVSFHNQIYELPYVACADNQTQTIVISIRGSLSLRDLVTDMCIGGDPMSFDIANPQITSSGCNVKVHRGILQAARYIYSAIESHKIIDDMLVLYPNYNVVITGHSLGGGIAAVLTLMLKSKYPFIRCFAFSPPGGVVSSELLSSSEESVCCVVVGDDLVPRLSIEALEALKNDVIEVINNTNTPKYILLLKGIFKLLCGSNQTDVEAGQPPCSPPPDPWTSPDSPLLSETSSRHNSVHSYTEPLTQPHKTKLYLPGKLMHIQHNPQAMQRDSPQPPFVVTWSHRSKLCNVKLSGRMISDHWAHTTSKVLHKAHRFTYNQMHEPIQS